MIIPIDEKWRIRSDAYCWHVERIGAFNAKTNKHRWRSLKYLSTLQRALAALARLQIMLHDSETLIDAIKFINETEKKFDKLLEANKGEMNER
tara:strand:- start:953 stop:1231 length:279 start_codon:yes stop_codon:yes gene_type:complete